MNRDANRGFRRQGFLAFLSVAFLISGCATPRTEGPVDRGSSLADAREVVLTVHGLSCPLCSNNLTGQLKRIPGVEQVEIDLNSGEVSVTLAAGRSVSRWHFLRAVEQAGFTLKDVRPVESP